MERLVSTGRYQIVSEVLREGLRMVEQRQAELALARLAGVSGLVPLVDWLLFSAIRANS